jgi:MoaA/NifB/PqqE/SkfB family radical SAM enzyme
MSEMIIPDELRFAVTRKCRGLCRHCYNASGKDADRLSTADYLKVMREGRALNPGLDRITLTGGEPLEEKARVLAIAEEARGWGMRVRLVTRGWELTPAVCRELGEAGVTRVQVGIDSPAAPYTDHHARRWDSFHSWLRAEEGSLKRAEDGIIAAREAGLSVSVRYSLARSNLALLDDTYDHVCALGVAKFKLRTLFPDGRAKGSLVKELVSGAEYARAQHALIAATRGRPTVAEITQPCHYPLSGRARLEQGGQAFNAYKERCICGKTAAYVDANGDVKYCLFDGTALGNVRSSPFIDVWNSAAAAEARRERCPLDLSGCGCSAFKILYEQFRDYAAFMAEYLAEARHLEMMLWPAGAAAGTD